MNITCTKTLGNLSGHKSAISKAKVQFEVVDCITAFLFEKWTCQWPEKHGSDDFFFPFQGKDGFDFRKPLSHSQHDTAVQKCATQLHLPTSKAHLRSFTSQSVRVGVSSEVAKQLRESLVDQNKLHGRASSSLMDCSTYVPDSVLMAPGPLFGDALGIKQKFDTYIQSHFDNIKEELLCACCGYPACTCERCSFEVGSESKSSASKRCSKKHTCWLPKQRGRKANAGPPEDDKCSTERLSAWKAFGVESAPCWAGRGFSFL